MLQFDEKGHLLPYEIIELTLPEFEQFFVEKLENTDHRRHLFENYLLFSGDLKTIVQPPFFQWMDGSFITLKTFPGDMDFVTFIDFEVFRAKIYELTWLKAKGKLEWNIDSNAAMVCAPHHFMFEDSLKTREFWRRLFGSTKTDEHDLSYPKGIIQINFEL